MPCPCPFPWHTSPLPTLVRAPPPGSTATGSHNANRRYSESYQPGSYGQEISYSLLNRGEVEVKWTGDGAPSQPFVQEFNRLLNLYASNKYEGKPRMRALAKNSFAILVSDYRNFRNGEPSVRPSE